MKKHLFGFLAFGLLLIVLPAQAQKIFTGKITYKATFSGDEKLVNQARGFMPALEEIISDGKKFRILDEGGFATKEILFEVGKNTYYLIDPKDETITKEKFRKRRKNINPSTIKKTDDVKIVAGLKAQKYEIWKGEKKRLEVWISDDYRWNLADHPYRFNRTLMLDGSASDFDNKVLLGLNFPHPTGKATITVWATEITTKIPKNAFKLPKGFKMVDDDKKTKFEKKGGGE